MDLATVIAALGLGGVAGAWFRAEHERTERFRERMIDAAHTFLADVAKARAALTQASRAISTLEVGEGSDVEKVREALLAADEAIADVDASVPPLAVVYPTLGRRTPVYESAGAIVVDLKTALRFLNNARAWAEEDRVKLEEIRQSLNYHEGVFAGNAHHQIWRRWFLKSSPIESARLWWRARRQENHPELQPPSNGGQLL